ncbi:MAG: folylpolyglutamate synthase/dihydrofolate synthase family protein [Schleiferiaceae bacterium]
MESYEDIVNWLFNQLPVYQRSGGANYKIDLTKTWQLMELLGHPQNQFKSIHVAGTNGKGSTSHMLASVLQEAGYNVGLYTSPHLVDFRERVKINGREISEERVIEYVTTYREDFVRLQLSFFEMTVGLAFWEFAQASKNNALDVAVIEVGMGGRLDSTNVVNPLVSIITNIGLDHTAFLGNTLEAIAGEKGGVIKPNTPVVIGQRIPETEGVFSALAREKNAPIIWAETETGYEPKKFPTDLLGSYQTQNKKTALAALYVLNQGKDLTIPESAIAKGLSKVAVNTGLRGRWELWGENPKIIADTAHNTEGLTAISKQLQSEEYDQLHIVWGMVNDKNAANLMKLMPKDAKWYLSAPSIPRAMELEDLQSVAESIGLDFQAFDSLPQAMESAKKNAAPTDFIYAGGSTFVIADLL